MQKTCQHIKSSGARCRAVALTSQPFCFWHNRIHRDHNQANRHFPSFYLPGNSVQARLENPDADLDHAGMRANYPISNELPPLEDAESIQIAISLIVRALADARIQEKRAALMLYGLQIAANNVRALRPAIEDSVEHIATTDAGIEIAVDPETQESVGSPALDMPSKQPATEVFTRSLKEAA